MPLTPTEKAKLLINKTWDKVWSTLKDHTFRVSVENQQEFPEIPEVKIPDFPQPIDTRAELKEIVKSITAQTNALKVKPDTSATKGDLLTALDKISSILSIEKDDVSPEIVSEIKALREDLVELSKIVPKTDLKPLESQIEALRGMFKWDELERFTRYDDIRVFINEKQFEKLSKSMSVAVSTGMNGPLNFAGGTVAKTNGLPTVIYSEDAIPLFIDPSTEAMPTVEYAHHEIHEGDHYFVKGWMDLTNGQVFDFLATTPDTLKWAHMLVEFGAEAESNITIYEGTTTSADGTPVTAVNRDRNSSNTAGLVITHTPTVTGVGTQIASYKMGSMQKSGGTVRANAELILKQNTKYLIRITNDTALNNWLDYLADWYEHENKH